MLFLRNAFIVLLLLTLTAISVVGIMVEAPQIFHYTPTRINDIGRSVITIMRPGHLMFITWWVILLGLFLVVLLTISRNRRKIKIEVQMGGGRIVIMDAAIKKYIRNALAEIGEVTVKKIQLREHRNLVTTDITADVRTRENLPTLERRIITRVRTALAEDLGITNLGDVHVFIRNFEVTGRPISSDPVAAVQPERTVAPVIEENAQPVAADIERDTAYKPVMESKLVPNSNPVLPEKEVVFTDSGMMTTEPAAAADDSLHTLGGHKEEPLVFDTDLAAHPADDLDEPMPWLKTDAIDKDDKDKDTFAS